MHFLQTVRRLLKVDVYAQLGFGIVASTTISRFILDSVLTYISFFLMLDTGSENGSSGLAAGSGGRGEGSNDEYEASVDFNRIYVSSIQPLTTKSSLYIFIVFGVATGTSASGISFMPTFLRIRSASSVKAKTRTTKT